MSTIDWPQLLGGVREIDLKPGWLERDIERAQRPRAVVMRDLLNAWLMSGAMDGADMDKLRADTEKALQP